MSAPLRSTSRWASGLSASARVPCAWSSGFDLGTRRALGMLRSTPSSSFPLASFYSSASSQGTPRQKSNSTIFTARCLGRYIRVSSRFALRSLRIQGKGMFHTPRPLTHSGRFLSLSLQFTLSGIG